MTISYLLEAFDAFHAAIPEPLLLALRGVRDCAESTLDLQQAAEVSTSKPEHL